MNKKILIAGLIGIAAGGIGGFFIADKYQLSLGSNESRAKLIFVEDTCVYERDQLIYALKSGLDDAHPSVLRAMRQFNECIGY